MPRPLQAVQPAAAAAARARAGRAAAPGSRFARAVVGGTDGGGGAAGGPGAAGWPEAAGAAGSEEAPKLGGIPPGLAVLFPA